MSKSLQQDIATLCSLSYLEQKQIKEYFDNLDPIQLNKYVTTNTYDTSQPHETQRYSENISKQKMEIVCKHTMENSVSKKWREYFGKGFYEVVFQETIECGFMVISRLLQSHIGEKFDVKDIKQMLIKEYAFFKNKNMYDILSAQGKTSIIKEMKKALEMSMRIPNRAEL